MTTKLDTPCIGVCSTVYGDDVCRGCKRFYHEVIDWNAFSQDQKEEVFTRLHMQIVKITNNYLEIDDFEKVVAAAKQYQVRLREPIQEYVVLYHLLQFAHHKLSDIDSIGVIPKVAHKHASLTSLFTLIDNEIYELACKYFTKQLGNQAEIKYD